MNDFHILNMLTGTPLLDVRSPGEFKRGHIPGAISFPLFSDEERAAVGTTYKQKGRDEAVLLGLEYVGPRMAEMVKKALQISPQKKIMIHCWRGGMRSGSVAWLLRQSGFNVQVIPGGYKAYRHEVQKYLTKPFKYVVLSGPTGSGKTDILKELAKSGNQVIDLESLASHKGSSFGSLGMQEQPAIEHFENLLVQQLTCMNPELPVWIEDESRKIGKVALNEAFWIQKVSAPVVRIEVPFNMRLKKLVNEYGNFSKEELSQGILRIGKRLGPQHTKAALENLEEGRLEAVAESCLLYYDKAYSYSFSRVDRTQVVSVEFDHLDAASIAQSIKKLPATFRY
ncbi:MAG: tRNA 2-selenouridine(34) synthase MnmH [Bacteroidia bacterium]